MRQHTALIPLPNELRAYGLNVIEMDGWDTAQGRYRWTLEDGSKSYDNPPSGVLFHGTAGSVSRPVVRTRYGRWSVANAWVGLDNGTGVLTTHPVAGSINRPTIYLTSAGPCRYSAGRGYQPVLDMMRDDIRPPLDAEGSTFPWKYANKHVFSVENTHPNDGSLIDGDVFDHLVGFGVVLHQMSQEWDDPWTERTLGHRTWTKRKPVDPWFTPHGLIGLQDEIQRELGGDMWIRDITDETWTGWYEDGHITGGADVMPDYYFSSTTTTGDDERVKAFNIAQQSMSKIQQQVITIDTETVQVVKTVRLS